MDNKKPPSESAEAARWPPFPWALALGYTTGHCRWAVKLTEVEVGTFALREERREREADEDHRRGERCGDDRALHNKTKSAFKVRQTNQTKKKRKADKNGQTSTGREREQALTR